MVAGPVGAGLDLGGMRHLDKIEREYLASQCWPMLYSRKRGTYEEYKPKPGQQEELDALLVHNPEHQFGQGGDGNLLLLCLFRETEGGPLLAFRYGASHEEQFFDYWADEAPFEVEEHSKVVTVYSYTRLDGKELS